MNKPVYLESPLTFKPSDSDDKLPSKIAGIAYTGTDLVGGWEGRFIVDLGTVRVADSMPLLNSHNSQDDVGILPEHVNDGKQLTVAGSLFSSIPGSSAEQIAMKSKLGAAYQMSIGVYNYNVERIKDGKSVTVNGRELMGPISVYRDGHIREVSVVTLGWDSDTLTEILKQRGNDMKLEDSGWDGDTLTEILKQRGNGMKLEEAQAKVTELTAEIANLTGKLTVATKAAAVADGKIADLLADNGRLTGELTVMKADQRKADVVATLEALGIDAGAELISQYCSMSEEVWDGVKAGMKLAKPPVSGDNLPDGLFKSMGAPKDGGSGAVTQIDMAKIYASRKV